MLQLHLRHDYHKIIFKIKHKLHTASGLDPPPPQVKNSGCLPDWSRKSTPLYAFMAQIETNLSLAFLCLRLCVPYGFRSKD